MEKTVNLTSRERIWRLFRKEEVDRPALKLWGAGLPGPQLHPAYQPVSDLAARISDLFIHTFFPFDVYFGGYRRECAEEWATDTADPLWKDWHTLFHTPAGDLHGIERISTVGEPSYTMEHMVKEPEDLQKLLTAPYKPIPVDPAPYDELVRAVGERGVVIPSLDHAGYALQRMTGSEALAYMSVDNRELVKEALEVFARRIREHAAAILAAGVRAPFQWVGPEVFIPPLLGPREFEEFVYSVDKPLCDLIHEGGGYVWVHCHGKTAGFLERFIDMGVDILNPLEPPKNGDIDLSEAVARYGNRIGWEGTIEIQEILQAEPERLRALIEECVRAGAPSGRFILCPSAGYMEYPFPSGRYIDNLLLYLRHGHDCVERCRK